VACPAKSKGRLTTKVTSMCEHVFVPEEPNPNDRLGSLQVACSKTAGGWLGALVGRSGRWEWQCRHEPPHPTIEAAKECGQAEVRLRRQGLHDRS